MYHFLSVFAYSFSLHLLTHKLYRLSQVKTTCGGLTKLEGNRTLLFQDKRTSERRRKYNNGL